MNDFEYGKMPYVGKPVGDMEYIKVPAIVKAIVIGIGIKIFTKILGAWKEAIAYVKVAGAWKESSPFVKTSGAWKDE